MEGARGEGNREGGRENGGARQKLGEVQGGFGLSSHGCSSLMQQKVSEKRKKMAPREK